MTKLVPDNCPICNRPPILHDHTHCLGAQIQKLSIENTKLKVSEKTLITLLNQAQKHLKFADPKEYELFVQIEDFFNE